jgi:hypothetical protein
VHALGEVRQVVVDLLGGDGQRNVEQRWILHQVAARQERIGGANVGVAGRRFRYSGARTGWRGRKGGAGELLVV